MVERNKSSATQSLVLCAHGRGVEADAGHVPERLAAELRRDGRFVDVRTAYLRGSPDLATALEAAESPDIIVVPLLMADGYTYRTLLPRTVVEVWRKPGEVTMAGLVGESRALRPVVLREALERCESRGWSAAETTVIVAGHGTERDCRSADTAKDLAADLARSGGFRDVRAAFLEQQPLLADALRACRPDPCLVVGFFIDRGGHGAGDIPRLIVWHHPDAEYTGPAGAFPGFAEVVLSVVDEAMEY